MSTVGLDETAIRRYIREQKKLESDKQELQFEQMIAEASEPFPAPFGGLPEAIRSAGGPSLGSDTTASRLQYD
jgi:hypothetical protein